MRPHAADDDDDDEDYVNEWTRNWTARVDEGVGARGKEFGGMLWVIINECVETGPQRAMWQNDEVFGVLADCELQ